MGSVPHLPLEGAELVGLLAGKGLLPLPNGEQAALPRSVRSRVLGAGKESGVMAWGTGGVWFEAFGA